MSFSELFIRRPVTTVLVMVLIVFFGVSAYRRLPVSDQPTVDLGNQRFETRALHRAAGEPAIVITRPDEDPAFVGLALDIGFAGFALGIERVEGLLQALF